MRYIVYGIVIISIATHEIIFIVEPGVLSVRLPRLIWLAKNSNGIVYVSMLHK